VARYAQSWQKCFPQTTQRSSRVLSSGSLQRMHRRSSTSDIQPFPREIFRRAPG
jgi:hypothetical protein